MEKVRQYPDCFFLRRVQGYTPYCLSCWFEILFLIYYTVNSSIRTIVYA